MVQAGFGNGVILKQASPDSRLVDPEFAGLRKLAAEVIKYAISDYHSSLKALAETRKHPYLFDTEYIEQMTRTRNETRGFLCDDTLFHQILDLEPAYFERLINEGTLPEVVWRADQRTEK